MRIVSRKLYRAFPELDKFSDELCEMYVKRVSSSVLYKAVATISFLGAACGSLVVVSFFLSMLNDLMGSIFEKYFPVPVILMLFFIFVIPCISALLARDFCMQAFLRRQVGRSRCLECGYSLLGQRIKREIIVCPECARSTTLMELGLDGPEDLIPPR